ncbi:chromosome segregation protein SMC [Polynucleobacter sp. MWH-Spelu-300-X4]|uniref:chromosome segregation protein SMC n=1 Tax=Polynucleobacter sp. MWH-Spelu-300-X4 TaxID=2689109 RepID=UPI001BFDF523|nr:chromosome segregation protein SMC [Polynucleobacter sp. MWH-Spelu-300-X4]QWD80562.1 chromosome segregation protein SMC [Polynucleobacter sp. MWH-Spelu-300-X4]
MRLKSIKLSGFKSFVDPTHFELPGQLIGVVGPNGCGKSNIIDAVRWVLGESRASELRGESMQDVIFNGSGQRKPAGRSSVELIFDNTDGRAAGQWSTFAELSVKRVLTRDGASSYYINNQSVRRKDIHDMFLGTGLGPRAYAIIGQGMISRIIEAKPEELRIFLEEAAGVSKYKERRKETEARLEDTRENLTRVEDILRELTQNLTKLEGQAEVAEKYKQLHVQMTEQQQLLWLVRQTEAGKEQEKFANAIRDAQVQLEEQTAKLRHAEAELEELRAAHYASQDTVSAAQGELYEVNAEVGKLENEIRYVQESRGRLQQQISDLQAQLSRWSSQELAAADSLRQANIDLEAARENEESFLEALQAIQERMPANEVAYLEAQKALDAAREAVSSTDQRLASLAERVLASGKQLDQVHQRQERLQLDLSGLVKPDAEALNLVTDRQMMAQRKADEAQQVSEDAQVKVPESDAARNTAQQTLQESSAALSQTQARLGALQALQEKVQAQAKVGPWLEQKGLSNKQRLWQDLHVEKGWETAFEAVLRERVTALQAADLNEAIRLAQDAPPSRLAFYSANSIATSDTTPAGLTSLISRVQIKDNAIRAVMQEWLGNVFIADSLEDAMRRRDQLPQGGVLLVKEGHIVSRVGLQLYAEDSEQAGLLARSQEIENLDLQLKAQQLILDEAQSEASRTQYAYQQAQEQAQQARQIAEQALREAHNLEVERLQLAQADEKYRTRAEQINNELHELSAQAEELKAVRDSGQSELDRAQEEKGTHGDSLSHAQDNYQAANHALEQARDALRLAEREAGEASFNTRTLVQRIADFTRDQQSAQQQVADIQVSLGSSQEELHTLSDEVAQNSLQSLLVQRSAKEAALANARTEMDAISHRLREGDESRLVIERSLQPLRDKAMELQLKEQAARLNVEQFATMLLDAEANIEELKARLTPEMKVSSLQSEVNKLNQEIQSLGPVNMAALEELASAQERKTFLDAQSADLNEAINTLTDAIQKIDSETRELLQGTFDQVNEHFAKLFPDLFGGGNAKLVMTGEEILDSGVQVMAQPPGKKNSSIHLLSGGEKALTAIALVFSLFQLNPAPFCLLDEVDAPLDDANTGRYADMVARMSANTQFVFISHNKITMEIAHQLIGVTMQEQGVSRIVAVDLESAATMVEAA